MTSLVHLARRFATSLSARPPVASEREWALSRLSPAEADLWQRMAVQDRRHSILVARRFLELCEAPVREEVAAALLHDVGKLASGLGTFRRVLATVIGPRTTKFREYHDHERLGAEMLHAAGSSTVTIELLLGRGRAASALRRADEI